MKKLLLIFLTIFLGLTTHTAIAQDKNDLCVGDYWTVEEGYQKLKEFAGLWNDKASWEKRAEQIREHLIKGMKLDQMPKIKGNFNPQITKSRKMDGYIVENIRIESFPGFYITGNIYRPTKVADKYAAILLPHGHVPDKRLTEDAQYPGAVLARMGAITFAYDMVGMGDYRGITTHYKNPIALLLQTWNSRRVLEYLLSRPDVDTNRVGITGGSGGATQSFLLTAIDSRIKACVPVVQVSAHFFGGCICETGMPIHKGPNFQTNNVEITALCAPRPMLIISDGNDYTHNTPKVEFPYIQRVYDVYDAGYKVENAHLAAEKHDYGHSKRVYMYNFFAYHFKLDTKNVTWNPTVDESFVTILPGDELKVYTPENPRPANTLIGNEAIIKYLNLK